MSATILLKRTLGTSPPNIAPVGTGVSFGELVYTYDTSDVGAGKSYKKLYVDHGRRFLHASPPCSCRLCCDRPGLGGVVDLDENHRLCRKRRGKGRQRPEEVAPTHTEASNHRTEAMGRRWLRNHPCDTCVLTHCSDSNRSTTRSIRCVKVPSTSSG